MSDVLAEIGMEQIIEREWMRGAGLEPCTVGPNRRPSFIKVALRYPYQRYWSQM